MGSAYVEKMKKGLPCEKDIKEIALMNDFIDAIREYATVITQPTFVFSVTGCTVGGTTTITINEVVVGVANSSSIIPVTHAGEIVDMINAAYPGKPYVATRSGSTITISGVQGASENGYSVLIAGVPGGMQYSLPGTLALAGGLDYKNTSAPPCLTDDQIAALLEKLCLMCKCSGCNEILNFANSDNNKI